MMDYYGLFEKSVWVPTPLSNFFHKDYPFRQGSNYYNITSFSYKLMLLTGVYAHSLILSMVLFLLLLIHFAKWNFIKADKTYSSVKVHIKVLIVICLGLVCVAVGSELFLHERLVKAMEPEALQETDWPGNVLYPDPREEDLNIEISEPVKNFHEACDRLMVATNETTVGYFKQYKLDVRGAYLANYAKEKFKRELEKFRNVQRMNESKPTVVATTNAFEKWKSIAWNRFLLFILMWFIFTSLVAASLYTAKYYEAKSWVIVLCALVSLCVASVMVTAECFGVADACQNPELIERTIEPEKAVEASPTTDKNCVEYFKNKLKAAEELVRNCAVIVQVGESIPQKIENNETCKSINVTEDTSYSEVCNSMKRSMVVALKTRRVVITNDLPSMQLHIALDENSTKIRVEGDNVDETKSSAVSNKLTVSPRKYEVFLIKFDEDFVKIKKLIDGRLLRSEIVHKSHAAAEMKSLPNVWTFTFDDQDETTTQAVILCCNDEMNLPHTFPQSEAPVNPYLGALSSFSARARHELRVFSRRVRRWHEEHAPRCPALAPRAPAYNYTEVCRRFCVDDYLLGPLVVQVIALLWTAVLLIVILLLYIWSRKSTSHELKVRMFGTPRVSATGISFTIKESTFGTTFTSQRRIHDGKSKKSNVININSKSDTKAKKSNVTADIAKTAAGRSSMPVSIASDSDIHKRRRAGRTGSNSARDISENRRSKRKETADELVEGSSSTVVRGRRGRSTERQLVKFDYDSESFDIWDKAGVEAIKNITVVEPETSRPFKRMHGCAQRDRFRGIFDIPDRK